MRSITTATLMMALAAPVAVHAQAAPKFSTASTTIGDLMANAEAKAVLEKHMPQILQYAGMVGGQTLKQLQGMAPDQMTDELLAKVDADLVKIK
jgi:hypothetical protein